jgi:hypothetical protein
MRRKPEFPYHVNVPLLGMMLTVDRSLNSADNGFVVYWAVRERIVVIIR